MKKSILFLIFILRLPLFFGEAVAEKTGSELMKIRITAGTIITEAILNDTKAAHDLYLRLPLKITMYPHQNRELYGEINLEYDIETRENYTPGDIAYWTPGKSLVLFYDQGYSGNIIIIGKMISDWKKLAEIKKSLTVKIEKITD